MALLPNPFAGFPNIYCPYEEGGKKVAVKVTKARTEASEELEQKKADNIIQLPGQNENEDEDQTAAIVGAVVSVSAAALAIAIKAGITYFTGVPAIAF